MNDPRLWIALTRPDNLVNALAVAALGRDRFASVHLLYEDSSWWDHVRWDEYQGLFAAIHRFSKVKTLRGLRDVPRYRRELRARQRRLAALEIDARDTIVTLAGITGLSNAIASAYPAVRKVFCLTSKKYEDASRPADYRRFRHTTSSWLQYHLLEPRAGVGRTLHLKPWRGGGDGVRLERLDKNLEEVFQALIILSNTGTDLPPGAGPQLFAAPFPDLNDFTALLPAAVREAVPTERRVVFFGTPFLLVRNLPPEQYAEILNRCLDYLREHYAATCRLIYRPHPAETSERRLLRLKGFVPEDDHEVAELYFLKHFRSIAAVYSVSSTVSRVAFNYGLNGYALWRCFPFVPPATTYFETLMGRVPEAFHIRALDEPPVAYTGKLGGEWKRGSFSATLARVLDGASAPPTDAAENPVARGGAYP